MINLRPRLFHIPGTDQAITLYARPNETYENVLAREEREKRIYEFLCDKSDPEYPKSRAELYQLAYSANLDPHLFLD